MLPETSMSLIRRAQSCDEAAWSRLVGIYGPLVYGWCRRAGLSEHDSADVGQEVFRSLYTALVNYSQELGRFRDWLRGIARNHLREFFRRESRQPPLVKNSMLEVSSERDAVDLLLAESEETAQELTLIVHRALEAVAPRVKHQTWQAFWRTVIDGEATDKVAASMGITCDSVRQARCRILRRLRDELADEFPDTL